MSVHSNNREKELISEIEFLRNKLNIMTNCWDSATEFLDQKDKEIKKLKEELRNEKRKMIALNHRIQMQEQQTSQNVEVMDEMEFEDFEEPSIHGISSSQIECKLTLNQRSESYYTKSDVEVNNENVVAIAE